MTAPLAQGSLPLRRKLYKAKAFWNHHIVSDFRFTRKAHLLYSRCAKFFMFLLSLNTTGAVAACEFFNFCKGYHVVVAFDGVLECGCCNCKFNSCLGALTVHQTVNQAAAEAITAANAVDDVKVVLLGEAVFIVCNVVKHCGPTVVECAVAFTKSDSNVLEVELISELLSNRLVTLVVELTAVDVGSFCLDTEYVLCILFVGCKRQRIGKARS